MLGRDEREPESGPARREEIIAGGARDERRVAAWIGASIVITGDLTSSEDTTIAGRVDGDITVRDHILVVARGARIRGDIVAGTVVVHGEVVGTITAQTKVEVGESGSLQGDLITPRLVIAEGAALHGRVGAAASRAAAGSGAPTGSGASGS